MTQLRSTDIRRAAMDLLARREHGFKELAAKVKKHFSKPWLELADPDQDLDSLIDEEVSKLQREGLQSDQRLAEAFVRARANRGQGPIKIKAELRTKGISDQYIEAAMSACEVDWFALAEQVASRKFGDMALDLKLRAKRQRFLQQRGFSFEHMKGRSE